MHTDLTPTEPAPIDTPDEPRAVFGVYPQLVNDQNFGRVLAIVVVPEKPEAKRVLAYLETHNRESGCMKRLHATRKEFFRTGPGRVLREKESRLAEMEKEATDARAELDRIRGEWKAAVATDSYSDVSKLERMIDQQEAKVKRLDTRLPVVREELARLRQDTANTLYATLLNARSEHEAKAKELLAGVTQELSDAVNAVWAKWLLASREVDLCHIPGEPLRLLASVEEDVPRAIVYAKPGTLPEPTPARTRPKPVVRDEFPAVPMGNGRVLPPPPKALTDGTGNVVQTEFGPMFRDADGALVDLPGGKNRN